MIIAAAASDSNETIVAALDSRPDAVVLSVDLPGGAVRTIERIRESLPETEFVVLASTADEDLMLEMVVAGVHGFLLGEMDPARLPHAVAGVLQGEASFPRRLVRAMADELARRDRRRRVPGNHGPALTPRETDVLEALAAGHGTATISRNLGITEATVRRHAASATRKLGARDRAEALVMMRTPGLKWAPQEDDASDAR